MAPCGPEVLSSLSIVLVAMFSLYLVSRDIKYIHLYKKLLAVNIPKAKEHGKSDEKDWPWEDEWDESWGDETHKQVPLATRP